MVTYRPTSDGDLMQIHEGKEVGLLGVKLAPDTQDLFAAAPAMLEALKQIAHKARTGEGNFNVADLADSAVARAEGKDL